MIYKSLPTKTPAGLISWYDANGLAVALMTSWFALIGGQSPRIKTSWPSRFDPVSRFCFASDFVLNVPYDKDLAMLGDFMQRGRMCLDARADLEYGCAPGTVVSAPLLLDCPVQIECTAGCLTEAQFGVELCGDPVRVHFADAIVDSCDVADLCAIEPFRTSRGLPW